MTAMWNHYCPAEKTEMAVGDGEPCNWCGAHETLTGLETQLQLRNPQNDRHPASATTLRVYNAGANTLNVYPPTAAQINALGLNNPDTITAGACKTYVGLSSALYRIKT